MSMASVVARAGQANAARAAISPDAPITWDDAAIATLEIPLADPAASPKHVSAAYYYKIPVRPINIPQASMPPAEQASIRRRRFPT